MILFFSGGGAFDGRPEVCIPNENPAVMLTYHEIHNKTGSWPRWKEHIKRKDLERKRKEKTRHESR